MQQAMLGLQLQDLGGCRIICGPFVAGWWCVVCFSWFVHPYFEPWMGMVLLARADTLNDWEGEEEEIPGLRAIWGQWHSCSRCRASWLNFVTANDFWMQSIAQNKRIRVSLNQLFNAGGVVICSANGLVPQHSKLVLVLNHCCCAVESQNERVFKCFLNVADVGDI